MNTVSHSMLKAAFERLKLSDAQNCNGAPTPKPLGRGKRLQLCLQERINSSASAKTLPRQHVPATFTVTSNVVPFTVKPVFEYAASFDPPILESERVTFLNKHFSKVGKEFLYKKSGVIVAYRLSEKELHRTLHNRLADQSVRMHLTFKNEIALPYQLLGTLLERPAGSIVRASSEVVPNFIAAVTKVDGKEMICVDRQFFIVQSRTIADTVKEFREKYGARFEEAVDFFLRKFYVYCKEDKQVYKLLKGNDESVLLGKANFRKTARADLCHAMEISWVAPAQSAAKNLFAEIQTYLSSEFFAHWRISFGDFVRFSARTLKPATLFFNGKTCKANGDGGWEQGRFRSARELCYWVIYHLPCDENVASNFYNCLLTDGSGMTVGKPLFFQIPSDSRKGYLQALNDIVDNPLQVVVVIVSDKGKPENLIKLACCTLKPIPYLIVQRKHVENPAEMRQHIRQLNVLLGGVPWSVEIPTNYLIAGIDISSPLDEKTGPVCSFVSVANDRWLSQADFLTDCFGECLESALNEALQHYKQTNKTLPAYVLLYQNCTAKNRSKLCEVYASIALNLDMPFAVVLVQKDAACFVHSDEAVLPGTVVEFSRKEFYLTSHCNSRATRYEIVQGRYDLSELEEITFKLCHLDYKQLKTAQIPAPTLYASRLSNLVGEELRQVPSKELDTCLHYI